MSIRTEKWSYVERLYEGPELYDRTIGRRETTNLAGLPEYAEIERDLHDRLARRLFETTDVLLSRRDPRIDDDLQRFIFGE